MLLQQAIPDVVEVWPENWPAVEMLIALGTQWRVSMGGPTGLDYNVLWTMIQRKKLSSEDEDDLFYCVTHLETEALKAMRPEQ